MARIGVSNSSPLIVLGLIGRLDILTASFETVVAPEEVAHEVRNFPHGVVPVLPVKNTGLFRALNLQMDTGEAAAIALAAETESGTVILDDRKGRRAARGLGLSVVGTVGLIVNAKRIGLIPAAKPLFNQLHDVGFFVSDKIIAKALAELNE